MNGITHIAAAFDQARADGRAALMPYFTVGYPSLPVSIEIIEAISRSGADLIELGVPFSDPLADGPTIQRSTQAALAAGTTVGACLEAAAELRRRGVNQPLLLMGYYNPILAYNLERFVHNAAAAGVDGLIVPDLPPEEAGPLQAACALNGLGLVFLLAPTSTPERIAAVSRCSTGFIYLVSLTGVTGARRDLPPDLHDFIARVRDQVRQDSETPLPLAVGFGISTPEQARLVGALADGVIVGSAVINAVDSAADPIEGAREFVSSLR
jgi:tryptophan synthase alpha chain